MSVTEVEAIRETAPSGLSVRALPRRNSSSSTFARFWATDPPDQSLRARFAGSGPDLTVNASNEEHNRDERQHWPRLHSGRILGIHLGTTDPTARRDEINAHEITASSSSDRGTRRRGMA
jgi:hypothetical protein